MMRLATPSGPQARASCAGGLPGEATSIKGCQTGTVQLALEAASGGVFPHHQLDDLMTHHAKPSDSAGASWPGV